MNTVPIHTGEKKDRRMYFKLRRALKRIEAASDFNLMGDWAIASNTAIFSGIGEGKRRVVLYNQVDNSLLVHGDYSPEQAEIIAQTGSPSDPVSAFILDMDTNYVRYGGLNKESLLGLVRECIKH